MRKILLLFCFFISGCSAPALHIIGVYEGSYPSEERNSFSHHADGYIEVKIHSKDKPLIIVLSSYEPVVWTLVADDGVEIKEIIISSYHPSKVVGLDSSIPVSRKSFGYSYKPVNSNSTFAIKIFEYTGIKEFESYQGVYKGATFSIY